MDDNQVVTDTQSIFAAERILKKRRGKGKMQYKVKWLGYPEDQEGGGVSRVNIGRLITTSLT